MQTLICKVLSLVISVFFICQSGIVFAAQTPTNYTFWHNTAWQVAQEAWHVMDGKPADVVVLTNAGYAVVNGCSTTEGCLDGLTKASGATVGKANLLEVHSSRDKALWFLFFDKLTGKSAYCEINSAAIPLDINQREEGATIPPNKLFTKVSAANIGVKHILENPAEWNERVQAKIFNGNEFALVTLANVAAHGAPYDFMKAALYHDHLCPGVNSGYLIANYLKQALPLQSTDEKYYIISTPVWCKEDALQTILNTTPGKSGMAVLPLDEKVKAQLIPEAQNLAGIYIRWNNKTKTGDGVVVGFNFEQANVISKIDNKQGFPWESKIKMDLFLLDYYDKPEMFVNTIKKFELQPGEKPENFATASKSVLTKLGLLK